MFGRGDYGVMSELVETGKVVDVDAVAALERLLIDMGGDTDASDLTAHHFAPGVYARELFIPKGHILTGKLHKTTHLNIVAQGRIAVASKDGQSILQAPHVFVSGPGTKRAGYALEDTTWITIHVTEETDLAKIEAEVIEPELKLERTCPGLP